MTTLDGYASSLWWRHYARMLRPETRVRRDSGSGTRALVWFVLGAVFALVVLR